jgi:dTDP-4-dehydrorhamnose reductase
MVSRYEMALAVARIFELDETRIAPVPSTFFSGIAPRPPNTTFATLRMESELGMAPLPLEVGLRRMAAERARRVAVR